MTDNVTEVDFSGPDKSVSAMLKKSEEVFRSEEDDRIILIGKDHEGEITIGFNHDLQVEAEKWAITYELVRAQRAIQELIDSVESQ